MEWKSVSKNDQGLVKIPKRWLHIHYYEALNILFRFENSLRTFVYAILKNEFSKDWKGCNFTVPGGSPNSVETLAAKRMKQAESFGYLGFDIKASMMHLTSGELVELITSDSYWPKFREYFKGNREIIKNKLLEIGSIRNSLAHFRPIKPDDIEVIKQNSKHTLLGAEQCLTNIFVQRLRVPTNTTNDWYVAISTLGTQKIAIAPFYSADESWINLTLSFDTPIIVKQKYFEHYYHYTLAKINTPKILAHSSALQKHITYLSEQVDYPSINEQFDVKITKRLNFVFRKDVLEANYIVLAEAFKEVLRKISEECELLIKDNLARGNILETASATAWWSKTEGKEDGRWNFDYNTLWQEYCSDDPDEYWGQHQYGDDIVGGIQRYPWMPADISEVESFLD